MKYVRLYSLDLIHSKSWYKGVDVKVEIVFGGNRSAWVETPFTSVYYEVIIISLVPPHCCISMVVQQKTFTNYTWIIMITHNVKIQTYI